MALTGTDAQTVRPYKGLHVLLCDDDLGVLVARHYLVPLPAVDVSPQARLRYYSTCLALS